MQIIEVKDATHRKLFLNMVDAIYKNDKVYVRPLDHEIEAVFDPQQNIFHSHGRITRWILLDDDAHCCLH
jgi:hypothetical protein